MRGYADEQVVITQNELARMLVVSPNTIKHMIQDGRLHPDKFIQSLGTEAFSLSEAKSIMAMRNDIVSTR